LAHDRAPTNLFVLLARGNYAARSGEKKAALKDYENAEHLKSDNVPALYQYGLSLLEDGQVPEAGATFDRLLTVAPKSPEGYYGRARYFAARGEGAFAAEGVSSCPPSRWTSPSATASQSRSSSHTRASGWLWCTPSWRRS